MPGVSVSEHIFRGGEFKLEGGELWRRGAINGVPQWICITEWMVSPLERTMLKLLQEAVER